MMLLEDFEHLVLTGYLAQFIRVLERRNAQQHAVVILLQPEEIELRGVGEERAIIEVYVFTYFIIGSIERTEVRSSFTFSTSPFSSKRAMASSVGTI